MLEWRNLHIPTHIMSGWCIGNLLPITPRQRLCCMIAATAADTDGVGILVSQQAYWNWHHKAGHNLFAAIAFAAILTAIPQPRRFVAFILYLAMAHLHLLMDYVGSGPGWPIYYLWPFSNDKIVNPNAWEFFSWQNILIAGILLVWTIVIAWRYKRTPLEAVMPNLDRQLVRI